MGCHRLLHGDLGTCFGEELGVCSEDRWPICRNASQVALPLHELMSS